MTSATLDDLRRLPLQLAHLASDPLLPGLGLDPARVAAFVAAELDTLDPYSAQVAAQETRWLTLVHKAGKVLPSL
jgi:hypothetical protein